MGGPGAAPVRFCPNCGTEVEEEAAFCPSCGQAIGEDPPERPARGEEADAPRHEQLTAAWRPATTEGVARPPDAERFDASASEAPGSAPRSTRRSVPRIPWTWPTSLSGWLIGIATAVGILALFLPWSAAGVGPLELAEPGYVDRWGLASATNVLFLLALLAVGALVFLAASLPEIPHRATLILAVMLIGLGIGLDRVGLGPLAFGGVLFLLAMLCGAVGALVAELGYDRGPG